MENVFTKKRHCGVVTGNRERIIKGLAASGWIVQLTYPAKHMTRGRHGN